MEDTANRNRPETINPRPRFKSSIETRELYDRLSKLAVGEMVTYEELSKLLGVKSVRASAAAALNYARHMAQRDHRIVTDAVWGVGIKRLSDSEAVAASSGTFSRIRRTAKRGIDRTTAVEFDTLSNEDKIRHNAAVSGLGVLRYLSKPKEIKKLEAAVNASQTGQLPIGRTLELFRQ